MVLQWHRPLVPEDVETARGLIELHQPSPPTGAPDIVIRQFCASAMHQVSAPRWPCDRHAWEAEVPAADERGEIRSVMDAAS